MKKVAPYLIIVIIFAIAGWYFFIKQPDPVHELPPPALLPATPSEVQQAQPESRESLAGNEAAPVVTIEPLPPLNESDPVITQALADIAGADPVAEYLVKNQAISRIVATVDSLTARQVPRQINPLKPVGGKFLVETDADKVVMSAQNFARYDGYVELLQNMSTDEMLSVYQRYQPLFQQAWEANGGEGLFNDRLLDVIDELLATPDVAGPVYLSKPEAVYVFEDPELESMTAGQKILVRMGSANASVVKNKLKEFKLLVGD